MNKTIPSSLKQNFNGNKSSKPSPPPIPLKTFHTKSSMFRPILPKPDPATPSTWTPSPLPAVSHGGGVSPGPKEGGAVVRVAATPSTPDTKASLLTRIQHSSGQMAVSREPPVSARDEGGASTEPVGSSSDPRGPSAHRGFPPPPGRGGPAPPQWKKSWDHHSGVGGHEASSTSVSAAGPHPSHPPHPASHASQAPMPAGLPKSSHAGFPPSHPSQLQAAKAGVEPTRSPQAFHLPPRPAPAGPPQGLPPHSHAPTGHGGDPAYSTAPPSQAGSGVADSSGGPSGPPHAGQSPLDIMKGNIEKVFHEEGMPRRGDKPSSSAPAPPPPAPSSSSATPTPGTSPQDPAHPAPRFHEQPAPAGGVHSSAEEAAGAGTYPSSDGSALSPSSSHPAARKAPRGARRRDDAPAPSSSKPPHSASSSNKAPGGVGGDKVYDFPDDSGDEESGPASSYLALRANKPPPDSSEKWGGGEGKPPADSADSSKSQADSADSSSEARPTGEEVGGGYYQASSSGEAGEAYASSGGVVSSMMRGEAEPPTVAPRHAEPRPLLDSRYETLSDDDD